MAILIAILNNQSKHFVFEGQMDFLVNLKGKRKHNYWEAADK